MLDGWVKLDQAGFQAVWVLLSVLWQSSVLLAAAGVWRTSCGEGGPPCGTPCGRRPSSWPR